MRPDRFLLEDIAEAATEIVTMSQDCTEESFVSDRTVRTSVVYHLIVIGEAANRISQELKARYPSVPWRLAIDQRNFLAHTYFSIDWGQVWRTSTRNMPELLFEIETILAIEFPDG